MILRSLRLRHGRIALPRPPIPFYARPIRRFYASDPFLTSEIPETPDISDVDTFEFVPDHFSKVDIPEIEPRTDNPFAAEPQDEATAATSGHALSSVNMPGHLSAENVLQDPSHEVAQDWAFRQAQRAITHHIGGDVGEHYEPYKLLADPPRPSDISLELLMASQSHLGHATSLWNPANSKYIFGIRDGIHIISLDVTASHLRRACKIVEGVASRGGLILFVGTRAGQEGAVVKAAKMAKACHLFDRWTPGSITNGQQILGKCRKQVVDEDDEPVEGFERQLRDSAVLKPDLVICLNPLENYVLLHECALNNIPTIGVIDTDANPTWVTYPIPANDDSIRCIQVIAGALGRAGEAGQEERLQFGAEGWITFPIRHNLEELSEDDLTLMQEDDAKEKESKKQQQIQARAAEFKARSQARDPRLEMLRKQQRKLVKKTGLQSYDSRQLPNDEGLVDHRDEAGFGEEDSI